MHSLVGSYIQSEKDEILPNGAVLYAFRLLLAHKRGKTYYLPNKEERDKWVEVMKKIIGQQSIEEFYEFKEFLGQGKFGVVNLGIHKKT